MIFHKKNKMLENKPIDNPKYSDLKVSTNQGSAMGDPQIHKV